jgi:hypothetical protein
MGWASGLQSGLQLGRAIKEGQERLAMEKIQGATADELEGYTEAQGRQLEGLAKSGGYDIVPQYAPADEGQTQGLFTGYQAVPRAGLQDQASGDMPAAPQTYAPQRVTDFLGQRYEGGLAPERMETIRTRAMANAVADPRLRQQMLMSVTAEERAQTAEGRAAAGELRAQEGFKTQQEASLLTIEEQRRLKKQRDEDEARQKQLSKDWSDRLSIKDADGNVTGMRPPTNEDMMWAAQSNAKNLAAAGKTTEALASFKDYMTTAKGQIELQGAERTEAIRAAAAKVNNGDLDAAKDFYDKFVPDGAKVKEFKQNADGSITVKRVDLNGTALPDTKTTKADILKGLVAFNDPAKLIDYAQQSFMNNIQTQQLGISQENLRVSQANQLLAEDTAASNKMTQLRQLSIAEQRAKQALPQGLKTFKDKEGNAVLVDTTRLEVGKDGVLKTPKGLVPVTTQTEPSYGDVRNLAADILKDPQQNKKMVDGKKVPITPAEAAAKARAALIKQNANMGDEDPTDRLIRLMRNAQAGNVVDSEVD